MKDERQDAVKKRYHRLGQVDGKESLMLRED